MQVTTTTRVKKEDVHKVIDLLEAFPDVSQEDRQKLLDGCSGDDTKQNDKSIWVFKRLLAVAERLGVQSPFDKEVLTTYANDIEILVAEKPSSRVHRTYFKKFIDVVCPEHQNSLGGRKSRSDRGRQRKGNGTGTGSISLDQLHDEEKNLQETTEVLSAPEHTRKKQAPSFDDLVDVPNNVTEFNPYVFKWRNGQNALVTIDVREELDFPFCTPKIVKRVCDVFRNMGASEPTKHTYLNQLRVVMRFNAKTFKSDNPLSTKVFKAYIYDLHDKVKRGVVKNSNTTIAQKQRWCNAILTALGEKRIPKRQQVKVKAGGNELVSDAYLNNEWIHIIRSLHFDRKRLEKLINNSGDISVNHINDYMSNCCLMLAIYTSATQSELFTSTYPDRVVSYESLGAGTWVVGGIKNRSNSENSDKLKMKHNGKVFLESFLKVSRKVNAFCNNTEYDLFVALELDGTSRQLTTADLTKYGKYLIRNYKRLQEIQDKYPDFSINTQRIRSSIQSKIQNEKGEFSSVISGKHKLSVHRAHKYSRGNRRKNQQEMAAATHVLEQFGRTGNLKIAIDSVEAEFGIRILDKSEYDKLKENESEFNDLPNGGTCKNKDTKEKRQFQRSLESNSTLDENDKKAMGCGYLVKCFGCDNFGVVDEVIDIWRLLSFEKKLNESFEYHVSLEHFIKNFAELKIKIEKLKARFTPRKLKAATKRLEREIHPFWDDDHAISDVLRGGENS